MGRGGESGTRLILAHAGCARAPKWMWSSIHKKKCLSHLESSHPPPTSLARAHTQPRMYTCTHARVSLRQGTAEEGHYRAWKAGAEGGGDLLTSTLSRQLPQRVTSPRTRHGGAFEAEHPGRTGTRCSSAVPEPARAWGGGWGEGRGVHATGRKIKREKFTSASSLSLSSCRERPVLPGWLFCPLLLRGCPPHPVFVSPQSGALARAPRFGTRAFCRQRRPRAAHPRPHIGRASRSPPLTSQVPAHPLTVITSLNHAHRWNTRRPPNAAFIATVVVVVIIIVVVAVVVERVRGSACDMLSQPTPQGHRARFMKSGRDARF